MNRSLKLLVVEDDALVGVDLVKTLTSFGYEVLGPICSGEEVVERFENLEPDLILMDIKLNGKLDGIQTAEIIQKKVALPIVFLTGLTDDENFQRAKLLNPYGYLIKPFDALELRSTIELTLHRFKTRGGRDDEEQATENNGEDLQSEFISNHASGQSEAEVIASYLSQVQLFRNFPSAEIEALAKRGRLRSFEAGEFISLEGGDASGGFIPVSGRISIMKSSDNGKELIVALLAPGDVLGLQFAHSAFAKSLSARTQIASRAIWFPTSEWEHFCKRNNALVDNLNLMLSNQLLMAYNLASSLAHASVEGRIVRTLLALLPQFGKTSAQFANTSRIYITRKELSELTGTTPETAYRVTKHLERSDFLDLTRPGILKITDVKGLREAAERA